MESLAWPARILPVLILALLTVTSAAQATDDPKLDQIRQRGHIRICADPSNLPFSSSDSANPGFEVELASLIARELGVEPRFHWILTWVRPVWELRKGQCDLFMGLPPTARFKESNPWIAISRPYYTATYAIVAKSDTGIRGPEDLAGKRVAVDAGRPADYYLLEKGFQRGLYKTQEAAFRAVEVDEAPVALLPLPIASWLARGKPELRVIPLRELALEVALGAATRAEDLALTQAVDRAIERLLASGAVDAILMRYGAIPPP